MTRQEIVVGTIYSSTIYSELLVLEIRLYGLVVYNPRLHNPVFAIRFAGARFNSITGSGGQPAGLSTWLHVRGILTTMDEDYREWLGTLREHRYGKRVANW